MILVIRGKRCCPVWMILSIIAGVALLVVVGYFIYKKLYCRCYYDYALDGEGQWVSDSSESEEGPRYTTDKDFV